MTYRFRRRGRYRTWIDADRIERFESTSGWGRARQVEATASPHGNVGETFRSPRQTEPTVFSRARGWISAWLITGVSRRKRSMIERTKGRA